MSDPRTILTILDYMQGKHALISGVGTAPTARFGQLNDADMPVVWTHPGPKSRTRQGRQFSVLQPTMTFTIWIIGGKLWLGEGVDENYEITLNLIDPISDYWMDTDPKMGGNARSVLAADDSGWLELPWAGVRYNAAKIDLSVVI